MSWETVKLGNVAQINPRCPEVELADSELVSFVPMECVDETTGAIVTLRARPFCQVRKGYTAFTKNDVIFAKITPCMQNGKHAIARDLVNNLGFGSTEFHVIRPGQKVIPEWIHFFLRRQSTLDAAMKTFTGSVGQQRVPQSFLDEVRIPLPPVTHQLCITAQLRAQLAAVAEARQAAQLQIKEISFLKTQGLSAIFSQIKSTGRIRDVAKVQSGFAFKSQEFTKAGVRLLRNANILPGRIYWDDVVYLSPNSTDQYRDYVLDDGDILISLDRPIISSGIKVARVGPQDLPSLLVQRVGRFLIDETRLDAGYLYAFIRTQSFINAISGHDQSLGVPHISPTQVESVDIPLPDLTQQKRITKLTEEIDRAADEAQASAQKQLTDIEMLPTRLLEQVFAEH